MVKSSVINTLRSKKVCSVAPIAGETKVSKVRPHVLRDIYLHVLDLYLLCTRILFHCV